jgi:hypothetical protein
MLKEGSGGPFNHHSIGLARHQHQTTFEKYTISPANRHTSTFNISYYNLYYIQYVYIYIHIEREREYVFSIIGPSCSFLYKLISSTPPGGGLQSCRGLIILPDTPKWIPKRQSSGLPLRWRGGSQAIGYRDSSLKLPRVSMDNLLGLASCMISPKALVAALRT